jgi:hypothetical protein
MADLPQINNTIAFVIDDTVVEVIHVGERFNAILTSNPTIVSVPSGIQPLVGYSYSTVSGFTAPGN